MKRNQLVFNNLTGSGRFQKWKRLFFNKMTASFVKIRSFPGPLCRGGHGIDLYIVALPPKRLPRFKACLDNDIKSNVVASRGRLPGPGFPPPRE